MEAKKNTNVDFRDKRPVFLLVGLTISLSLTLMAFESKQYVVPEDICVLPTPDFYVDEDIPLTIHPIIPPPPPPKEYKLIEVEEEPDPKIDPSDLFPDEIDDQTKVPAIVVEDLPDEVPEVDPIVIAEFAASFPGGNTSWTKFLQKNLEYPRKAQRMGIEGKVFLSFIVDKSGNLSDIQVIRGIGAGCDEEAKRVLSQSPQWNPGLQRGHAVRTRMSLQVIFKLN